MKLKIFIKIEPSVNYKDLAGDLKTAMQERSGLQGKEIHINPDAGGLVLTIDVRDFNNEEKAFRFYYDELFELANSVIPDYQTLKLVRLP